LKRKGSDGKNSKYLGQDGRVFEEKGLYSWNKEGNTITLNGIKNSPNQYFIGENKLIQLDANGNRITGTLSDKYVLLK
jgi:copper homeostasis protein (lipoprotein)